MKVVVIGGGFIGQLVQLVMPKARVLDWRKTPPQHHLETRMGPQYLWEPIRYLDKIVSESFTVRTLVDGIAPTPESILAYKQKIGKLDDGGDWAAQFQPVMTGWSSALPVPRIEYGRTVKMVDLPAKKLGMEDFSMIDYDVLVNTIPMPSFLDMMIVGPEYREQFKSDPIYMAKKDGCPPPPVDEMVLNYISHANDTHYRETSVGTTRFYETLVPPHGRDQYTKILPGKIHPHPESETILNALASYGVFCFGRFATWRPDELAHQSWEEIQTWKANL
jgi:hypothetical protein